jgi:actin-like ATPase involved in cell morphogenesis
MQGKTHEDIKTIRPLKDGVIADFHASEHMIKEFIKKFLELKVNSACIKNCNLYSFWYYRS